jgi:hypothetical protein
MRKKITIELSEAELDQLRQYIHERDSTGWYYGNKDRFEERHSHISEQFRRGLSAFIPRKYKKFDA